MRCVVCSSSAHGACSIEYIVLLYALVVQCTLQCMQYVVHGRSMVLHAIRSSGWDGYLRIW